MTDDGGRPVKRVKCPGCGRVVAWAFASGAVGCVLWHVKERGLRRREWVRQESDEQAVLVTPAEEGMRAAHGGGVDSHVFWFRWDEPMVTPPQSCCGDGVAVATCGKCHVSYDLRDVHAAVNSMVRNRRESIKLRTRFDTL